MDDEETKWHINKVKGSFAEAICRAHFEAMGYFVEPYGIESIAPYYSSLKYKKNTGTATYWNKFSKNFTKQPDFLISRIDNENNRDSLLVEVKYRNEFQPSALKKEFQDSYGFLNDKPVLFYVVARKPTPKVNLLFNQQWHKWAEANDKYLLHFSIYKGKEGFLNLVQAYDEIALPVLNELIG